jgi:hypothetical protein
MAGIVCYTGTNSRHAVRSREPSSAACLINIALSLRQCCLEAPVTSVTGRGILPRWGKPQRSTHGEYPKTSAITDVTVIGTRCAFTTEHVSNATCVTLFSIVFSRERLVSRKSKSFERELSDPTPDEIRERSAEVRRGWSKRVAARRQAWAEPTWSPPLVMTVELIREMNARQD